MKTISYLLLSSVMLSFSVRNSDIRGQQGHQPPACLTAEEDRQNMMYQLGITELRPGKNADQAGPNPANYDESKANPFPDLPGLLITGDGQKVTTPEMWWEQRRPEIAADFAWEVYGRVPEDTPEVTWEVVLSEREYIGWTPVIARKVIGHMDNSAYPLIDVDISMVVVTPERAEGPVPVLMMFGPAYLPAPAQPDREDFEQLNEAPTQQIIQAGWGYVRIDPSSIQADNGAGLTCGGIIGLVNKGQPRKPDDWGALRAWSWGAARGLDYLESDPDVDAEKVGIEGVSRYGKAALVTLAFEQRFAFGLIGSSGKGGATLHRRNYGEAVENLTGGEYYWMAGNYLKYGTSEGEHGRMDAGDLPVDSHQLIAMCAPRLTFISYGIPEQGDAHWLDQRGSYMATVAAQPAFRLLGVKAMGVSDDYMKAKMPEVNHGLLDGYLGWRQHDSGHTDAPNIPYFIEWVNAHIHQ
ncbi:MAG: acetylxylan esterase [Bacteroidales bacterium]